MLRNTSIRRAFVCVYVCVDVKIDRFVVTASALLATAAARHENTSYVCGTCPAGGSIDLTINAPARRVSLSIWGGSSSSGNGGDVLCGICT